MFLDPDSPAEPTCVAFTVQYDFRVPVVGTSVKLDEGSTLSYILIGVLLLCRII